MFFFFFNDTATTEIYTLSLHDALPIFPLEDIAAADRQGNSGDLHGIRVAAAGCIAARRGVRRARKRVVFGFQLPVHGEARDRKSTRLNSSHLVISYAVFCLKKKHQARGPRTSARGPRESGTLPSLRPGLDSRCTRTARTTAEQAPLVLRRR